MFGALTPAAPARSPRRGRFPNSARFQSSAPELLPTRGSRRIVPRPIRSVLAAVTPASGGAVHRGARRLPCRKSSYSCKRKQSPASDNESKKTDRTVTSELRPLATSDGSQTIQGIVPAPLDCFYVH